MEIFGLDISAEDVYMPREDTFLLAGIVEKEVEECEEVLEIGTGSGIISLLASDKANEVTGVDIDGKAVKTSKQNAEENGIKNVDFFKSDLFENVDGKFDLVIFNPPYIPGGSEEERYEGNKQWHGGETGRKTIKRFCKDLKEHLKDEGRSLIVISSVTGVEETVDLFEDEGFDVEMVREKKVPWETLYVLKAAL